MTELERFDKQIERFNKQNHKYIYRASRVSNTYGRGYSIYGKMGVHDYYGFTLRVATRMYNQESKKTS